MFGEDRAQHPGTAGDQHRALGIQHRGGDQDDLSGMAGLAHIAEGLRGVQQAVAGGGQRLEDTGGEQLRQGRPRRLQAVRRRAGQVVGLIGDSGMGRGDVAGQADVGLADFDEMASAGQQLQRSVDEISAAGC